MGPAIIYLIMTVLVAVGVVGATALPRLRRSQEETRHRSRTSTES